MYKKKDLWDPSPPQILICKRDSVTRFLTFFLALKIRPRPHMNRQKGFSEILRFREDIWKLGVSVVNYYTDTQIFKFFNLLLDV